MHRVVHARARAVLVVPGGERVLDNGEGVQDRLDHARAQAVLVALRGRQVLGEEVGAQERVDHAHVQAVLVVLGDEHAQDHGEEVQGRIPGANR